ncbi:MAG: GNAT family N-acetyltransferase [Actinomycetota bacterium]
MIQLYAPSAALHAAWVEAMREFEGETLHGFSTFGFEVDELESTAGFDRWLERERQQNERAFDGFVPATAWWIVDDADPSRVLGSIHLRHELNDWLLAEGGHIGYGVRPTARGRGVATAALRLVLERAAAMRIDRVLLLCDDDNPASRGTILAAGGVREDAPGPYERYWISLG